MVAQDYTGWVRTAVNGAGDAVDQILVSPVVRGGTMAPGGKLILIGDWDIVNSGLTKTLSMYVGATTLSAIGLTTSETLKAMIEMQVVTSNSQKIFNGSSYGASGNAYLSTALDITGDLTVNIKCKWSAAAVETITLVGYSIVYFPGV